MVFGPGINAAKEKASLPEVSCSAFICSVGVKNMGNWEKTNEELMVFDIVYSRSKNQKCHIFNRNREEKH